MIFSDRKGWGLKIFMKESCSILEDNFYSLEWQSETGIIKDKGLSHPYLWKNTSSK